MSFTPDLLCYVYAVSSKRLNEMRTVLAYRYKYKLGWQLPLHLNGFFSSFYFFSVDGVGSFSRKTTLCSTKRALLGRYPPSPPYTISGFNNELF